MKELKRIIQQTGLKQGRLAEILGFSSPVFNRYLLNKRDPDGLAFHVIFQAEEVLEEARNSIHALPWPKPGAEDIQYLDKEIQISREKIAGLERELKVEEEKISKARMALAWLQLWEKNSLHPQKPWSSDFLQAEKGFAQLKLGAQSRQKILNFELQQAKERLQFLENLQADGSSAV